MLIVRMCEDIFCNEEKNVALSGNGYIILLTYLQTGMSECNVV